MSTSIGDSLPRRRGSLGELALPRGRMHRAWGIAAAVGRGLRPSRCTKWNLIRVCIGNFLLRRRGSLGEFALPWGRMRRAWGGRIRVGRRFRRSRCTRARPTSGCPFRNPCREPCRKDRGDEQEPAQPGCWSHGRGIRFDEVRDKVRDKGCDEGSAGGGFADKGPGDSPPAHARSTGAGANRRPSTFWCGSPSH